MGLISNGTNLNAGMFMGVNTSAATANNIGVSVDLVGSGAAGNLGFNASVTGDNSVNNGIRVRLDGNNGDNTGMGLDVGTTSSTTNTNKGIDVNVTGSSVSNNGITSNATGAANFLNSAISGHADGATWTNYNNPQGNIGVWGDAKSGTGVSNTVNTAVKGDANGDGSYNSSFMGDASGNTNTLNVGLAQNCHGNSNNSWSGPGSYLTGWQANVGSFASVFGQSSVNIGGMAEIIDGGTDNTGSEVYGLIGSSVANGCHSQVGVWGYLGNAPANSIANYAVRGTAPGGAGGGVFGPTNGTSPVAPSYAGYFEGDVFATNTYYYSDPKLKTNISEYKGAMDLLGKLAIKRYTFRTEEYPYMNLPQGEQVGVLSSDLKKVCPGLVKPAVHLSTRKGDAQVSFEAVNYNALIPVLVQAVKEVNDKADNPELAKKVADQQNLINVQAQLLADQGRQIADLRNMLDDLCTNGCAGFSPRGNTTMPAAQSAVLYQSVPNPASGTVTIGYAINMPYSAASIKVVTIDDKLISEYKINGQGSGSISFDTNNMAAGVYKYYLSIDGKIADAKSMSVSNK